MTDPEIVSWARACVRVLEDEGIAPSASIGVARMGLVIIAVHTCDDADSVAWRAQYMSEKSEGPVPETEFARLIRQAQPHVAVVKASWNRIAACLGLHVGNPLIFERGWAALHVVEGERLLERTAL